MRMHRSLYIGVDKCIQTFIQTNTYIYTHIYRGHSRHMKHVYQQQTIHKYISDNKTVYNSDHIGKGMGMGIKYMNMDLEMNIHIKISGGSTICIRRK